MQKISHYAFNTSLSGNADDRIFESYYRNGSGGWIEGSDLKEIDNVHYDDGSGVLASNADDYVIVHWVYVIIGQAPKLATVYGRGYYPTVVEAQKETAPTDVPISIKGAGFLVGRVIIAKNSNNVDLVESAFSSTFVNSSTDDHLQYALLSGRASGQVFIGGSLVDDTLSIQGNNASGNVATNPNLIFKVGDAGVTTAMTILNNGNVGIGATDPGAYSLYVNGTGFLNDAGWTYASDRRLKENIEPLANSLAVIEKLNPVSFDYLTGRKNQFGFIAQEVQEVLPELVEKRPDGMLGLRTDSLLPIAIQAIQEQQKEIEELQNNAGQQAINKNKTGLETISSGKEFIEVKTKAVGKDSKIFIAFEGNPEAYSWTEKEKDSHEEYVGFKIFISNVAKENLKVNWKIED